MVETIRDSIDQKIEEMESSIKYIAKYVKGEIEKAEKDGTKEMKGYELRVQNLESEIKKLSQGMKLEIDGMRREVKEGNLKGIMDAKKTPKIDNLDEKVNAATQEMLRTINESKKAVSQELEEKLTKEITNFENDMKDVVSHVRNELNTLKRDVERSSGGNIGELEKRLNEEIEKVQGLVGDSNSVVSKKLENQFKDEVHRVEGYIADSTKVMQEEIEQKMQKEIDRLEDLVFSSGKALTQKGMDEYLQRINKAKANLERYVNVKVQVLETRIKELAELIKEKDTHHSLNSEEKFLATEDRLRQELNQLKKVVQSLGSSEHGLRHGSDKELAKEVEDLKKAFQSLVPETELVGVHHGAKTLRKKLDVFESAEELRKFRKDVEHHISVGDPEIGHMKDKMEENMKKMALDFSLKVKEMKKELEHDREHLHDKMGEKRDGKDLHELRKELKELRKNLEEESAFRLSLEKNFDDLEHSVKHYSVSDEMKEIKQLIETETSDRMALEKKVSDMERMVISLKEQYAPMQKLSNLDFDKLQSEITQFKESLQDKDKDVKMKMMGLITQQMNEFAKNMDKRIPDIVTKDEFEARLRMIKENMGGAKAQDLGPLVHRVESLEHQLSKIANMMSSVSKKHPMVIE